MSEASTPAPSAGATTVPPPLPQFRLDVEYTFDDFVEASAAHQSAVDSRMRWPGLIAWGVVMVAAHVTQIWWKPAPAPVAGGAPPQLGAALLNLGAGLLAIVSWTLPLIFVAVNVILSLRSRPVARRGAYQRLRHRREPVNQTAWMWTLAIVLTTQYLTGVLDKFLADPEATFMRLARSQAFGLVPVLMICVLALVYRPRTRLWRVWQGQPSLHGVQTFTISDAGVRYDGSSSRSETSWAGYRACVETDNLFVLFLSDLAFNIIPKRAVPGGEPRVEELARLLRENIAQPTRGFPV